MATPSHVTVTVTSERRIFGVLIFRRTRRVRSTYLPVGA